ncbi:MAG: SPOR domain-containing protein [Proteobacteria bacterium]|nr:SPOR domain-containing protein [Pseudomonadota bacterium]
MNYRYRAIALIIVSLSVVLSCTAFKSAHEKPPPLHWNKKDKSPTIVILPFENNSDEPDIQALFRRSFANSMSSKNYRDLKLDEVDAALAILEHSYGKPWRKFTPMNLGKLFHCDFLIYGEVTMFRKLFLGLYAQVAVGLQIKMVETSYGTVVWEKELVKRAHEGGIPISPFGVIPDFLRCSMHLREEQKITLVERGCRELMADVPNPPKPAVSVFIIGIQVASFADKARAVKIMKELKTRGYDARIEKVVLGSKKWFRIIIGPYYEQREAVAIKRVIGKDPRFQPVFIHY